jgi:hypothetical protein
LPELEEKLGAILANPQLMQQIMGMAQSLQQQSSQKQEAEPQGTPFMPDVDPVMIGKIMNIAVKTGIDSNQKSLLHALEPYLTQQRLQKLEKAMRAAKLAGAASAILGSGSISFLSGR